jgi:hypothetical protein
LTRTPLRALALLLAAAGLSSSCFQLDIADGKLRCSTGGRCPRGFICRTDDDHCWRTPGSSSPDASRNDGSLPPLDAPTDRPADGPDGPLSLDGPSPHDGPLADMGSLGLGAACRANSECRSTFCADGVCCQTACTESCKACNLTASPGVCSNAAAGAEVLAGHQPCTPTAQANCGLDGRCDGAGACRLWNDVPCQPASCDPVAQRGTSESKCNGAGMCVTPSAIACAPYVCNGTTACFTACSSMAQCAAGNACTGGSCGKKPNGSPCTAVGDCQSNFCVDGVCCESACTGQCEACDIGAGTCAVVTSGQPHGMRTACAGSGACAGSCTGGSRTACGYPTVPCRGQSCAGSALTQAASCNGAGACPAPSSSPCPGSLVCNPGGTACLPSCTTSADCLSTHFCNPGGTCTARKANGVGCGSGTECTSGICVDDLCCNSACGGQCEACDVTGSPGICTAVTSGGPRGARAACSGSGVCAGSCTAASRTSCTASTAQCRVQSCSGNTLTAAATCSGGACPAPVSSICPGDLRCNAPGTACLASCIGDGDCVAPNVCSLGACGVTCFVAGTLVETALGLRAIETIQPGELVATFDVLDGRRLLRPVRALERRRAGGLSELHFASGQTIVLSPEHQMWVAGSGWVRAAELTLEDRLFDSRGAETTLAGLVSRPALPMASGAVEVFNLVVEEFNTYFVGEDRVLVHSCDFLGFSSRPAGEMPR